MRLDLVAVAALGLALAIGCAPEPPSPSMRTCEAGGTEQAGIIRYLNFAGGEMGQTIGFDLDESVGPVVESNCRARDWMDAEGRVGIDNQATLLIPVIEEQVGVGTIEMLLNGAINSGQLLLAITLEGLDDPDNDDCVAIAIRPLRGPVLVGTDGLLLAGQTMDVDLDGPVSRYEGAVLRDGVLETGPFEARLPVSILDAIFTIDFHDTRIRVQLNDDGSMDGVIAGGIGLDQIGEIAAGLNIPSDLMGMVATFGALIADLAPNEEGRCTQFSTSIEFRATYGFVNR